MRIVLVGAGGYGQTYLDLLVGPPLKAARLVGVVDPYAKTLPAHDAMAGVPCYDTLADFYREQVADLAIIATPIPLHEEQALAALQAGTHVFCEKPPMPTLQQADRVAAAAQSRGLCFGVGYQWSYSGVMQAIKADILSGKLGRPLLMNACVAWPRRGAYYAQGGWKGRVRDAQGRWVLDSVATNATAHDLHNLFYLLGDTMRTAAMPTWIRGSLYRGHTIETFDTCFLQGAFENGCTFAYVASHASDGPELREARYCFENAQVRLNPDGKVTAHWNDGRETCYGDTLDPAENARKVLGMINSIRTGRPPDCGLDTARPHLAVCNAAFDYLPIHPFDPKLIVPAGDWLSVPGLYAAMRRLFEAGEMPDPAQSDAPDWAAAPIRVDMDGIRQFEGRLV